LLVTPPISATGCTFADESTYLGDLFPVPNRPIDIDRPATWYPASPTKFQSVGFCDWISLYQRHGGRLPRVSDGAFFSVDANGVTVNTRLKRLALEGSHETKVFIRCDGDTVWFEGNASRFRRPDNVFGYTFRQCVDRVNALLGEFDLPPFTEGDRYITNWRSMPRSAWTGAKVTRIDLTENYATGSKEDAYHFMRWLGTQQGTRMKVGTYGDGETVDFNRGSRRVYSKAYLKGPEIRRTGIATDYLERLADWCDAVGLVRFESTVKSNQLDYLRCNYLGGFDMKQLELEFEKRKETLDRASAEIEEITDAPKHLLSTYRMWAAGDDITAKLSRRSFFYHRKELLAYGVDISVKPDLGNVEFLKPKTRVIRLGPVSPPDWYELPEIERRRYGTHG